MLELGQTLGVDYLCLSFLTSCPQANQSRICWPLWPSPPGCHGLLIVSLSCLRPGSFINKCLYRLFWVPGAILSTLQTWTRLIFIMNYQVGTSITSFCRWELKRLSLLKSPSRVWLGQRLEPGRLPGGLHCSPLLSLASTFRSLDSRNRLVPPRGWKRSTLDAHLLSFLHHIFKNPKIFLNASRSLRSLY